MSMMQIIQSFDNGSNFFSVCQKYGGLLLVCPFSAGTTLFCLVPRRLVM